LNNRKTTGNIALIFLKWEIQFKKKKIRIKGEKKKKKKKMK